MPADDSDRGAAEKREEGVLVSFNDGGWIAVNVDGAIATKNYRKHQLQRIGGADSRLAVGCRVEVVSSSARSAWKPPKKSEKRAAPGPSEGDTQCQTRVLQRDVTESSAARDRRPASG